MTMIKIDLTGCKSFEAKKEQYIEKALAAFDVLESAEGAGNDFLGWNHLPSEMPQQLLDDCKAVAESWKAKKVNLVVAIGIGGSYLGAKAAISALSHNFSVNIDKEPVQVVFAGNTLSEDYMADLVDLMEMRNVAAVVISKSGTTTEPAVAFRIIKAFIEEKYGKKEAAERIVAVTDKARGALKTLATSEGYKSFVIEDNIGGRYSVLTPVGLVPIAAAGFDIDAAASPKTILLSNTPLQEIACTTKARRSNCSSTTIPSSSISASGGNSSSVKAKVRTAKVYSPHQSAILPTCTLWASMFRKARGLCSRL